MESATRIMCKEEKLFEFRTDWYLEAHFSGHYMKLSNRGKELGFLERVSMVSAAEGPRCFPGGNILKSPSGMYVPVELVAQGSIVLSALGNKLQVMKARVHKEPDNGHVQIIELVTTSARLEVTGTHRIVTATGSQLAGNLKRGSQVLVTGRVLETLEDVRVLWKRVEVYELTFFPDEPVEAISAPPVQILSMGQACCQTRSSDGVPPRIRTRRPGMNQRLARQAAAAEDQQSVPETAEVWE